jgi:hypothetical protein
VTGCTAVGAVVEASAGLLTAGGLLAASDSGCCSGQDKVISAAWQDHKGLHT